MSQPFIRSLVQLVHRDLIPKLHVESLDPHNPVVVHDVPPPWYLLGAGNYAAVVAHPDYPDQVVKVYAPGRPGWAEEVEVYRRIGVHPAFSTCYASGENFLILKRLRGITLYDCLHQGLYIPAQVIRDIDQALDDARQRGLHPHDVHGRNVMMAQGRGLVVDISDFLQQDDCSAWRDLKRGYYWLYRPLFSWLRPRVSYRWLDTVRSLYRYYRHFLKWVQKLSANVNSHKFQKP